MTNSIRKPTDAARPAENGRKFLENGRKPAVYPVLHNGSWDADWGYNFVILPIGTFYHKGIRDARPGDRIVFLDKQERTVHDICEVEIRSGMFRNLCRMRYGRETDVVLRQWRRTAVSMGYAPNAIDWDTAAVVWYKEDKEKGREENQKKRFAI